MLQEHLNEDEEADGFDMSETAENLMKEMDESSAIFGGAPPQTDVLEQLLRRSSHAKQKVNATRKDVVKGIPLRVRLVFFSVHNNYS